MGPQPQLVSASGQAQGPESATLRAAPPQAQIPGSKPEKEAPPRACRELAPPANTAEGPFARAHLWGSPPLPSQTPWVRLWGAPPTAEGGQVPPSCPARLELRDRLPPARPQHAECPRSCPTLPVTLTVAQALRVRAGPWEAVLAPDTPVP